MNDTRLDRPDLTAAEAEAYVRAACTAVGLPLDEAALARVIEVFAMNARIASRVTAFDVPELEDPLALTRLP